MAAIDLSKDAPDTARDIVLGGRLLAENADVRPKKADRISTIETVVGNLFTPGSAGALNDYVKAADALYAARRVPTGDLTYDADVYEQALRDVMGNPVEFNGRNILPPVPNMDEDDVTDAIQRLTFDDLQTFGNGAPAFADGQAFLPGMFDSRFFGAEAQLVTSPGRYLVFFEGLGFAQVDGEPYELDLRGFIEQGAL